MFWFGKRTYAIIIGGLAAVPKTSPMQHNEYTYSQDNKVAAPASVSSAEGEQAPL